MVGATIFRPQAIAGARARRSAARTKARRWRPTPRSRPRSRPRWRPRAPQRDAPLGVTIARPIAPAYDAESALGNLFADLMRAARPTADVALTTGGSLRAELPAGALTYGQLHEALPFDDRFVTIAITGADLAALVARNLGRDGRHRLAVGRARDRGLRRRRAAGDADAPRRQADRARRTADPRHQRIPGDRRRRRVPGRGPRARRRPTDDGPPIRDVMADVLRARKTPIDPANPPLYDAAHPRLAYPGRRPVRCGDAPERAFSRAAVQPLSLRRLVMALAPQMAGPPPGLTTTKAPFIEEARAHGDIYIHQPYELYSAENQATWGALLGRMQDRWQRYANERFLEGLDKLQLSPARIPRLEEINRFLQPLTGFRARAGQRLRAVVRVLRLPAPARVPDHDHDPRRRAAGVPARARHLPRRRRARADAHRSRLRRRRWSASATARPRRRAARRRSRTSTRSCAA